MIDSKHISILTASFNMGATIERTLTSIGNQSYQNFEHIVIDGGSKDETIKILKKYEKSYNLKWISEPDQGIADALNKGIKLAKAGYILVIQADDRLLSNDVLEKVSSLIISENYDIQSFPVILDHPEYGRILRKPIQHLWFNHFKFIFPHQGCFVKKSLLNKLGGFNTRFKICLDYDFFYKALLSNASVKFGNTPIAIMGGKGIGCDPKNLISRIKEERTVQILNEPNPLWRLAQFFFYLLYLPYKKYGLESDTGRKILTKLLK